MASTKAGSSLLLTRKSEDALFVFELACRDTHMFQWEGTPYNDVILVQSPPAAMATWDVVAPSDPYPIEQQGTWSGGDVHGSVNPCRLHWVRFRSFQRLSAAE